MRKIIISVSVVLLFQIASSFKMQETVEISTLQTNKSSDWLQGKWYPMYYYYETSDGGNMKKEHEDVCTLKSYIEFFVKNKKESFISMYSNGKDCESFSSPIEGTFKLNESERSIDLFYSKTYKKSYDYQLADENTLILTEYRDVTGDGIKEKVMDYYSRK